MASNHLILYHPLLLLSSLLPSFRVFSNKLALCIRWPKYWSFCFSISPSNEYSGLISFKTDWLDLFAVQGTFKSLSQHTSGKHQLSSLALSLLNGPTLTSVRDCWKNQSFNYRCQKFVNSVVSLFLVITINEILRDPQHLKCDRKIPMISPAEKTRELMTEVVCCLYSWLKEILNVNERLMKTKMCFTDSS